MKNNNNKKPQLTGKAGINGQFRMHMIRLESLTQGYLKDCKRLSHDVLGADVSSTLIFRLSLAALKAELEALKSQKNSPAFPEIRRAYQVNMMQLAGRMDKPLSHYFTE